MASQTRFDSLSLTAGEPLIVLDTVAIETFAKAATVRMSGVLATLLRVPLIATNRSYSQ
jgi:hypothetical protein